MAQRQAQPHTTAGPGAGGVRPVKRIAQAGQLAWVNPGAVVTHGQADHAGRIALGAQQHRRARAVAQRVVQQVAHQQLQARPVQPQHRQGLAKLQQHTAVGKLRGHQVLHQRIQVGGGALQCGGAHGQALGLQQVTDQVAHQTQVAQQGIALGPIGQQLSVQAGTGERRAQLMADGQQQASLAVQHVLQATGHVVDLRRQLTQFIAPAQRDGL